MIEKDTQTDVSYIANQLQDNEDPYKVPYEDFFTSTLNQYDEFDNEAWKKKTGYTCPNNPIFNNKMEGLESGLYLIAGESNSGKSAFMMNLLWDYAMHPENNLFGIYFSLDDMADKIIPRIISMNELIPISVSSKPERYKEFIELGEENCSLYQDWLDKRQQGLDKLRSLNKKFKIEDSVERDRNGKQIKLDCGEKILDYCIKLQDYIKGEDPEANIIVGIDSLFDLNFPSQNFKAGDDKALNDYIAKEVKRWSVEVLKVPIFGTVHLRKFDQKRRPNIADLKESGRYAYEANVVFIVYNDVSRNGQSASIYYTEPNSIEFLPIIEIQWAKNKQSSFKGRTYYHFVPNYSKTIECNQEEMNRFDSLIYTR